MALPDNGIEEKLKKISTKFTDLDYKIDTIMNTGNSNGSSARENSLTAILKNFQEIKKEHAQMSADMANFKVRVVNLYYFVVFSCL